MKININTPDEEIPELTKECFNRLKDTYGYNLKITDLPDYLKLLTDMNLEHVDYQETWTPMFVSYLIDLQHRFMKGDDLDMVVFHQDIIKVFHPSGLEKKLLVKNNIEERLWAIWLAVSNPSKQKFNITND